MFEDTKGVKSEELTWRTDNTIVKTGMDSCALEGHVLSGRQSTTHKTKVEQHEQCDHSIK